MISRTACVCIHSLAFMIPLLRLCNDMCNYPSHQSVMQLKQLRHYFIFTFLIWLSFGNMGVKGHFLLKTVKLIIFSSLRRESRLLTENWQKRVKEIKITHNG